jgi:hypothetical protein
MTWGVLFVIHGLGCVDDYLKIWVYVCTLISSWIFLIRKDVSLRLLADGGVGFLFFIFMGFVAWGVDVVFGFVDLDFSEKCFVVVREPLSVILSFLIFPCLAIGYVGSFLGQWVSGRAGP